MTRSGDGDLLIRQLLATGTTRRVAASTSPIQGWVSSYYYVTAHRLPRPSSPCVAESARRSTLLVPFHATNARERPPVTVRDIRVTPDGFRFVVSVEGRRERLVATASGVTVSR